MSGLPENWEEVLLDDVAQWGSGGTPARSNPAYYNGKIPWIKTGELGSGLITETEETISELGLQNSSAKIFSKGAVAVAMYGATIGKTSIMGIDAATNQACAVGVPVVGVTTTGYLHYYIQSQKDAFIEAGKGGAQPNISQGVIKDWPIPLPPFNEQKRIAEKLDVLLTKVDACRARLDRVPQVLNRFRQAVLAAATTGQLTDDWREENKIDEWEWSTLSKLDVSVQTGPFGSALHKHDYVSNGVPLINPMHIRGGQIFPNTDQSVSEHKLKELTRFLLRPGDIVLGRRGEMGRAAVVRVPGLLCGTGSLFLRATSERVVPDFLGLLLRSPYTCAFLEDGSVGSTMTNLNQRIVGALEFPKVSPDEQHEIVRRVDTLFTLADRLEARYSAARKQVDQLTPSLLAKAFRGELVPQDPNDEPAEKLLERIRTAHVTCGNTETKARRIKTLVQK